MARHSSKAQRDTIQRVMHAFKEGVLEMRGGRKVRNPKQAIAIALHEAGASNQESPEANRRTLRRTKRRERAGLADGSGSSSRQALYDEARRRNIPGRSKMNKAALLRALQP